MSSSETPMIRRPGMNPALARWKSPGSSLRRDRSPVAPKRTTTCGYRGPTRDDFLAKIAFLPYVAGCAEDPTRATSPGRARSAAEELLLGRPLVNRTLGRGGTLACPRRADGRE